MGISDFFQAVALAVVILFFLVFAGGCATSGGHGEVVGVVAEHEVAVARLADTARDLDELYTRVAGRVEDIGRQAAGIAGAIDRLEYTFNEYDRLVTELLGAIGAIRDETEGKK